MYKIHDRAELYNLGRFINSFFGIRQLCYELKAGADRHGGVAKKYRINTSINNSQTIL